MEMNWAQYSFNFIEMFLGKNFAPLFLLEIFIRTTIMYLYTLINLRLFRTRSIAQLTSFELIIVIALGSAVGDPMFYPGIPMINGMICITTIIVLTKIISMLAERSELLESAIEGRATLLIHNGEIIKKNLRKKDMPLDELFARLRLKGIKNIGQIEYAFLETSGQLSVIEYDTPKPGQSTLKHI